MTSISNSDYTIPSPRPSIVIWLLGLLVVAGVATLGLAAFHAFSQVVMPAQAVFGAFVIEAGMIVEALALVRARRARDLVLPLSGVVISVAVSATYNYTQVSLAARNIHLTDQVQLLALALGPLAAIVFLAVNLGRELRRHEQAVGQWAEERQTWFDSERVRLASEATASAQREQVRQDRLALKLEKIRQQENGNANGTPMASLAKRGNYGAFKAAQLARNGQGPMTAKMVTESFGVPIRTAYNWLEKHTIETASDEVPHEN